MKYAVIIERDPETGSVGASSPDLEDVFIVGSAGDSDEEMLAQFRSSAEAYLAYLREHGHPIPVPRHHVEMIELS
jgi:predicted RNase H-like HicB family nuclease